MGVDFMKSKAGSFNKSWSKGGHRLCAPDFFASNPQFVTRTMLAPLSPGRTAKECERLLLMLESDGVGVYRQNSKLASVSPVPEDVLTALKQSAGCAVARVEKYLRRASALRLVIEQ